MPTITTIVRAEQFRSFGRLIAVILALSTAACGIVTTGDIARQEIQTLSYAQSTTTNLVLSPERVDRLGELYRKLWTGEKLSQLELKELDDHARKIRIRGFRTDTPAEERRSRAEVNTALMRYTRDVESRSYPTPFDKRPNICMAMSGGGMRSASFNMGVLIALNELGLAEKIDVFSSVSGGGYTLGWLQMHVANGTAAADLLGDPRWYDEMIKPDLIDEFHLAFGVGIFGAIKPLSDGYEVGLANGIGLYPATNAYAHRIYDAFSLPSFMGDRKLLLNNTRSRRIGYPIFNIAGFPIHDLRYDENDNGPISRHFLRHSLNEASFEFTPHRHGSEAFGYNDNWPTPLNSWKDVIAISGSAIPNPFDAGSVKWWPKLGARLQMVVPLGNKFQVDEQTPVRFYLTDGGFNENLGAFPLIRRMCKTLIIVDAEHDPQWLFEAYELLKVRLARENDISLEIPRVETLSGKLRSSSCTPRADDTCLPKPRSDCSAKPYDGDCFAAAHQPHTVFEGSIRNVEVAEGESINSVPTRVVYIKLGANLQDGDRLPADVRSYLQDCDLDRQNVCEFPQDATSDQRYSKARFRAYRALGADAVRHSRHIFEQLLR
jgi:hypothetical protein